MTAQISFALKAWNRICNGTRPKTCSRLSVVPNITRKTNRLQPFLYVSFSRRNMCEAGLLVVRRQYLIWIEKEPVKIRHWDHNSNQKEAEISGNYISLRANGHPANYCKCEVTKESSIRCNSVAGEKCGCYGETVENALLPLLSWLRKALPGIHALVGVGALLHQELSPLLVWFILDIDLLCLWLVCCHQLVQRYQQELRIVYELQLTEGEWDVLLRVVGDAGDVSL